MKQKRYLNIYGTVFNNAEYIEYCISSIKLLLLAKDTKKIALWIVDNYSTDGTIDKLMEMSKNKKYTKYIDFHIYQAKCSRGKGRQIALDYAIRHSYSLYDIIMYIDFDNIITPEMAKLVNTNISKLKENEISSFLLSPISFLNTEIIYPFGLSTIKTNVNLEWKDLNAGEDWERLARAKSKGIKVITDNDRDKYPKKYGIALDKADERRYAKGLSYYIRKFNYEVDNIRGRGGSKYSYLKYIRKGIKRRIIFELAYPIAKRKGIYRYDNKDNESYVRGI